MDAAVVRILETAGLTEFQTGVEKLGVISLCDLCELQQCDFEELGLTRVQHRRLIRIVNDHEADEHAAKRPRIQVLQEVASVMKHDRDSQSATLASGTSVPSLPDDLNNLNGSTTNLSQIDADDSLASLRSERAQVSSLRADIHSDLSTLMKSLELGEAFHDSSIPSVVCDFASDCKAELRAAEESAAKKQIYVPLFGSTGAGKSTLLNAIFCQDVVPTSGWRACTAVPVELEQVDLQTQFQAEVLLKGLAEWEKEVDGFLGDLMMVDRVRVSRREPVRGGEATPTEVAYDTLRAVYPEAFATQKPWPTKAAAKAHLQFIKNRVTNQHKRSQVLQFVDSKASSLAQHVLDYVDSANIDGTAAFWPLIKKVRMSGNFNSHPSVVLVDAPGVQDSNTARGNVVKQLLQEAGAIVIVSAIKRAANEKVAQEMLGERFRRQMLMDGHYGGSLAFVATCTDELTLSELCRNLNIPGDTPQHEAAQLRNCMTKQKLRTDCYEGVRRMQSQAEAGRSSISRLRSKGVMPAVFTTSARDYQKLRGFLDAGVDGAAKVWSKAEDTEIPQLRSWLHALGQKADLAALENADSKLELLCAKLQGIGTGSIEKGLLDRWVAHARLKVSEIINRSIQDQLLSVSEQLRSSFLHRVETGRQDAAESAVQTMNPKCRPKGEGGMHHGTFKAACRRGGEWREDWNELLIDPLNRAIAVEWDEMLNQSLPGCIEKVLEHIGLELLHVQEDMHLPKMPFQEAVGLLKSKTAVVKESLRSEQMEMSRTIKETVKRLMGPSYRDGERQSGTGMDVRQKGIIREQIRSRGTAMFSEATEFLTQELDRLLASLQHQLQSIADEALGGIEGAMTRLGADEKDILALQDFRKLCIDIVESVLVNVDARRTKWQELRRLAGKKEALGLQDDDMEDDVCDDVSEAPQNKEIPNELLCPISQELMRDPVLTSDGHTYERELIEAWLQTKLTSPVTGLPLPNKDLIPNVSLRKLIQDFQVTEEPECDDS